MFYVFQFKNNLRNELRAKSGIMRGREFVMKDMYSYTVSEEAHEAFYQKAIEAYKRVFERVGLGDRTFLTYASGGAFTAKFSHEFQTLTDAGEDAIYLHREKKVAVNKEILRDDVLAELGLSRDELEEVKAAETGNIFSFGDVKSKQLGLMYKDEKGEEKSVILGSYGIGITRVMGTLVEVFADDKGLVWPESVAPFQVHLVSLGRDEDEISQAADALHDDLLKAGVEVLYDDRDMSAGAKFAESDLLGIPKRIVVGKGAVASGLFEVVERRTGEVTKVPRAELFR